MRAVIKLNPKGEGPFLAHPYVVNIYDWDEHYQSDKLVAVAYASTSLLAATIANSFNVPVDVEV